MSEDRKSRILNSILSTISSVGDDERSDSKSNSKLDLRNAKDLIGALASWAGKGKDEIVQMLCREIGVAVAAVAKEPLTKVLENRKLRVTLEFVPKTAAAEPKSKKPKKKLQKNHRPS